MRKFGLGRFVPLGLASLASSLLISCAEEAAPEAEFLRPVRYLVVDNQSAGRTRGFSGVTKSTQESRLSFKVSGTVVDIPVQIGQQLGAGDLIARVDPASYSLQTEQARATLAQSQANERNAQANYERTKGLYANDNTSLNDLDASRANAESAAAQVRAADRALDIARLNQSYTTLRAETDCSITSIDVEVNENVNPGELVAQVSCGDQIEIDIDIPESLIAEIDPGMPVEVVLASVTGKRYAGVVAEVSSASAGSAASFPAVVRVTNPDEDLRSGLAADVRFQLSGGGEGRVMLPVSSVIHDPSGTFVFVAEPNDSPGEAFVRRRDVALGELGEGGIEIVDGVVPGDRVVTAGVSIVREGQRVLIP